MSAVLAATAIGGVMGEATGAETTAADGRAETLVQLATDFLDGKEPIGLVRARGARLDETFAKTGSHAFEIGDLAGPGSAVFVATDAKAVSPDTLTLVPAAGIWLKLETLTARFGPPRRMPAMPGRSWLYRFSLDEDRSLDAELSGDPAGSASRVVTLRALRER